MNPETPPPYPGSQNRGQAQQNMVDPTSDPTYGYNQGYHNDVKPVVIQPGMMGMPPTEPYAEVPDYLVLSIISILFCTCLGIVSIVKSTNARQNKAAGRYLTALRDAQTAKQTAIAGIVLGIILTAVLIAVRVALASNSQS